MSATRHTPLLALLCTAGFVATFVSGALARSQGLVPQSGLHVSAALGTLVLAVLWGAKARGSAALAALLAAAAALGVRTAPPPFLPADLARPLAGPPGAIAHALAGVTAAVALALALTRGLALAPGAPDRALALFRSVARVLAVSVALQVSLGAAVRHLGAGLSIPDFPLAMGRLVPPFDSPYVALHFAHRVVGMVVVTLALIVSGVASIDLESDPAAGRAARALAALIALQVALGGYVIWWQRDVAVTTGHVVNGAVIAALAALLALRVR